MTLMEQIHVGKKPAPPRIMVYGPEGIGKTTFGAGAPNPIIIPTEDGLGQIDCHSFPLAKTIGDVFDAITALYESEHGYATVVIDSLDWTEKLIWAEVCKDRNVKSLDDIPYAKGYGYCLPYFRNLLVGLNALREKRGMAVLLLAHSAVQRFEDPETESYDRYVPGLHKAAAALLMEWCDAVVFCTRKFRVEKQDQGFGRKRAIAVGIGADGGDRIMRTEGSPVCVAKNRYRLPSELPLDWAEMAKYMFE